MSESINLQISTDGGKSYKKLTCEPVTIKTVRFRDIIRKAKEKARIANICNRIAVDGIIVASLTN